jgi:hypothetical protein
MWKEMLTVWSNVGAGNFFTASIASSMVWSFPAVASLAAALYRLLRLVMAMWVGAVVAGKVFSNQ